MELRILRTYVHALKPGVEPIYGPGSRGQFYRKPIDRLQFYNAETKEWADVPIVELPEPKPDKGGE